tara:strand:- start:442 stop:657 length:216 start_codon:yes stop_codon:yes gene_type:complete
MRLHEIDQNINELDLKDIIKAVNLGRSVGKLKDKGVAKSAMNWLLRKKLPAYLDRKGDEIANRRRQQRERQ